MPTVLSDSPSSAYLLIGSGPLRDLVSIDLQRTRKGEKVLKIFFDQAIPKPLLFGKEF
jgi:hypothetical protein